MNKQKLMDELNKKMNKEWDEYLQNVYKLPIERVVLDCSYKTIMLEEFKNLISMDGEKYLSEKQIEKMLQLNDLLNTLYSYWLKVEDCCEDEYIRFIFDNWVKERLV